ncbi:hypothetical protein PR048_027656 [Dryococelus australis]|uniref:Uncharacterized protein n=1 Tax=Dryococelus australis TaxID=614101 RepID=A0ABQ9GH42_9NEOP|nr:hypothetical protein PR048_027656 [Dryococelus australis]
MDTNIKVLFEVLCEKIDALTREVRDLKDNTMLRTLVESVKSTRDNENKICAVCSVSVVASSSAKKIYRKVVGKNKEINSDSKASSGDKISGNVVQHEQVNKLQDQQNVSKQPAPAAYADGFVEVRRSDTKTVSSSPQSKQEAARKPIQLGVRNNINIKTVPKQAKPRMKAMFVSR